MKLVRMLKGALGGAALGAAAVTGAAAQEDEAFRMGVCYDLSRAYTFITPQIVQAGRDLADLINADGGIGGHPIELTVQDHGNEPQRGIECYERLRRDGVFVFDFLSTPVSLAVVPRAMRDEVVMMQSLVGRGDAINGEVFEWVFPVGPTYWGQAANDIAFIKEQNGGSLEDMTIGFVYLDYPFGQEPIRILETLAEREGFELQLYPVPLPGNDQSATWTQVRRNQPDYMISWLLANGHVVASREMQRNGYPISQYIAVNWLNEVDIENIGNEAATGILRGTNVVGGQDIPIIQEIIAELYEEGEGNGPREMINDVYYNTGVAMYSVVFEAARLAYEADGWPITPESMRRGLRSLEEYDANGLFAPVTVTESDHGGGGRTRVEMWDGETWVPQNDWTAAYQDVIWDVVDQYSSEFTLEED
ncbi:MAG: branched-chain amino acid transport system substrate-binding protein [Rhodobacteraceae bacterium HLUCCA12]|nr:MAG: branched-chain amino acid transport system substrate-binding protein [Rhodobacteraceae bacterium HLUCCA12]